MADILFWLVVAALGIGAFTNFILHDGEPGTGFFMGIMAGVLLFVFFSGATVVEGGAQVPAFAAFWTFTAFWFWALLVIGAILVVAFFLNEYEGFAFSSFAAMLFLLFCLTYGPMDVVQYVADNKAFLGFMLFLYFTTAPIVMFLRWTIFNWDELERYEDNQNNFLQMHGRVRERWTEHIRAEWEYTSRPYEGPKARQHKRRLINYMIYWPLHLVDLVLRDFLWRVFKRVYQLCIPLLDGISARVARSAETPRVG